MGRQSDGGYRQFLGVARGSNLEVQTQLVIASELGFGETQLLNTCESLSDEVARMLVALMRSIPK